MKMVEIKNAKTGEVIRDDDGKVKMEEVKITTEDKIKAIQIHQLEVRDREKMRIIKEEKARKETLTPEEAAVEVRLPDPHEEGKQHDKIRSFMDRFRSDSHIWDFVLEEEFMKVPHVMRVQADPCKSYVDGRVQRLMDLISTIGSQLKTLNAERWQLINERVNDIFQARESE